MGLLLPHTLNALPATFRPLTTIPFPYDPT